MMKQLQRFRLFLGESRFYTLLGLFATTGIISTVALFVQAEWSTTLQTVMTAIFLAGAAWLIGGRMDADTRYRWLAALLPAVGLILLGALFFPHLLAAFMGAAVGWMVVGLFIFGRSRAPIEYKQAIKAMHKGDYETAVSVMDALIKAEPQEPNHYRLRAEMLRLWGKLGRARRDYEKMSQIATTALIQAVAYNGLAEVDLQDKRFLQARDAAQKALELAPEEWVAAYNLGMIEDRLGNSEAVIRHLDRALSVKVPEARHRLLMYVYLLRAYSCLDRAEAAEMALTKLKQQRNGLQEWQGILGSPQAAVLRDVLASDVETAQALIEGRIAWQALADKVMA